MVQPQKILLNCRQRLGVLLYEWRYYQRLLKADDCLWLTLHNRGESIICDAASYGVACQWRWTSLLHAPRLFPSLGRRLMQRALQSFPVRLVADADALTSDAPQVSFVIGHRGAPRLPHLLMTLQSIAAQRDVTWECIVVEQTPVPEIRDVLPTWVRYVHNRPDPSDAPYNRALAFNVGAAKSRGEVLILHDNDLLVPDCYAQDIWTQHAAGYEVINQKRFIFYLAATDTQRLCTEHGSLEGMTPVEIMQNATGGGSIAVDRTTYFELGGHDEEFVGWGGEDCDFWDRAMTRKVYPYARLPLIHLWHPDQPDKTPQKDSNAMQRYHTISKFSPEQRIAALHAKAPLI